MQRHKEANARVSAPPATVFARLDDQARLGGHMEKPSLMMGGGRMTYEFDAQKGRAVGSHIRMGGSAFGLKLSLDEVVTQHVPPERKAWRTVGQPKLIIVGAYEMGFDLTPVAGGAALKVWIDYDLPPLRTRAAPPRPGRWLRAVVCGPDGRRRRARLRRSGRGGRQAAG